MRYILITLCALLLIGSSPEDARNANEAYDNGEYEKAISLFKKAIDADPDNAKLYYNLASAQAKVGNAEEAIRTFEQFKSMTGDSEQRAMADYNIGNILAESKKWDQALQYYKKSLRYMSGDEDAKHNYELAERKKEEQQQQQQNQQNQQNNDQQQQQNQDQQKQKQQQQQDQNQQQNQNQQDQQDQQQQNQQNQQNQQQQQSQKSNISETEAENILRALEQKEKDLLKKFKKQKMKSAKNTNEKDW
ncbi:MAG TPA: tetratricopeptide repeat protein [Fodinibius sp.]|nr:tetratricopeptide repeat protein [Fodinibius sp.]